MLKIELSNCYAIYVRTVGYDQDEFYEIKQFLTIQLMSDMAGISRETAGHIIHELKDEKLVVKDHKIG